MRDIPRHFTAPTLSVWTCGAPLPGDGRRPESGCAVFVSHASPKLRVDADRLALGLAERGLRFEGLTRSSGNAVPPGMTGLLETPWDGGDAVDLILALVDRARPRPAKPHAAARDRVHAPV